MKESTRKKIDAVILHLISGLSVVFYLFAAALLYPTGYLDDVLVYVSLPAIAGICLISKKPRITRKLFLATVFGTIVAILSYILTTAHDPAVFTFIFILLSAPCIILSFLALRFLR